LKKTDNKEILGQGGYGTVYEDTWNGRKVAVKRIPLTHISSNEREKEALKKLVHPNVVKLFHVDKDENFK
jgi:serine/threonine protein kinase